MKRVWIVLFLMMLGAASAAQDKPANNTPADLYGSWSGSWEGMGQTGGFDLTLAKPADGSTGARVAVTGEPAYQATIRTIAFEGKQMTAAYDFPPDDSLEIRLTATFDGDTAKGTWTARGKADGGELASGTWTVKRK
jgi:hypothetical protein